MQYLLDTNIIIYWLNGNLDLEKRIIQSGFDNLAISFINLCELYYGAYKSSKIEKNIKTIENLKFQIKVLHSNNAIAETFGRLKAISIDNGKSIDGADLIIASFAITYNLTLITPTFSPFDIK